MSKNITLRDELLRRIAETHELRHRIIGFLSMSYELAPEFCPKPQAVWYTVQRGRSFLLKRFENLEEGARICACCNRSSMEGGEEESSSSVSSNEEDAGFTWIWVVYLHNFHRHHLKYIKKTTNSIDRISEILRQREVFVCGRCDYCLLQSWRVCHRTDLSNPYELTATLRLRPSQLLGCNVSCAHCPDIDRRKMGVCGKFYIPAGYCSQSCLGNTTLTLPLCFAGKSERSEASVCADTITFRSSAIIVCLCQKIDRMWFAYLFSMCTSRFVCSTLIISWNSVLATCRLNFLSLIYFAAL